MPYRCVATSVAGFVQQLATCYLPHGYWFYVQGRIPPDKDPVAVDAKLVAKYGISLSRSARARRKRVGIANVHYLRWGESFVLLATHGHHPFFDAEGANLRDARRVPIKLAGYSISVRRGGYRRRTDPRLPAVRDDRWRVSVRIGQPEYRRLKAHFQDRSLRSSAEALGAELYRLPYEPYAPVRQQVLNLVRLINRRRKTAGLSLVRPKALRFRRRIVSVFGPGGPTGGTAVPVSVDADATLVGLWDEMLGET